MSLCCTATLTATFVALRLIWTRLLDSDAIRRLCEFALEHLLRHFLYVEIPMLSYLDQMARLTLYKIVCLSEAFKFRLWSTRPGTLVMPNRAYMSTQFPPKARNITAFCWLVGTACADLRRPPLAWSN
jgi:hypothetical protein